MRRGLGIALIAGVVLSGACSRNDAAALEIPAGTEVTLEKQDGVRVEGRLVEVRADQLTVESRTGRTVIPRSAIASISARPAARNAAPGARSDAPRPEDARGPVDGTAASPAPGIGPRERAAASNEPAPPRAARAPEYREVTIEAGTVLPVELKTAVSSDGSSVEDPVRAALRRPLVVDGEQVLPAGTAVLGHVTAAERSARVKGRARVALRFTSLDAPGEAERVAIRTETVARVAEGTRKQDAAKIGGGAAGGAIIGGILGGGDGAAKGAAIGGAAGTGVVLSTRGREVRLEPGADLSVRLTAPVTVRVRVG